MGRWSTPMGKRPTEGHPANLTALQRLFREPWRSDLSTARAFRLPLQARLSATSSFLSPVSLRVFLRLPGANHQPFGQIIYRAPTASRLILQDFACVVGTQIKPFPLHSGPYAPENSHWHRACFSDYAVRPTKEEQT
jgi:hypothetical protein